MTTPDRSAPYAAGMRLWRALGDWLMKHTYPASWLPPRWRHPASGYLAALLLELLAVGLTWLLALLFPPFVFQGALLGLVIVLVAVSWGEGPSILVTLLGAVLLAFVVLPPYFSWEIDDLSDTIGMGLYLVTGVTASLLASKAGRARRTAEHAQARLEQVLEVLPAGVNITDRDGHLLKMNRAMRTLWDRETAPLGASICTLGAGWRPSPSSPGAPQENLLRRALRTGAVGLGQEVEIETLAGQRKTILHSAAPIRDDSGMIVGAVAANIEITERKQLEEAVRAAMAQMDTFLGIASHELKTPLTSLALQLDVTGRRLHQMVAAEAQPTIGPTSQLIPVQESLARMKQHLRRLERLVNDLLELSLMQAGKLELRSEPLGLVGLVRQVVEEQQDLSSRRITLRLPAGRSVPLRADAMHIEQVLTNYLSNALKYSPDDQPVEVGLEVEERQVRVWVRDAGPGIPQSEQVHIWERFHRVAGIEVQSGSEIGLGLGLSICREIVERHHGQVGLESTPGHGSTFWFTLPLAPEEAGGEPEGRSQKTEPADAR
jgi:signal transduction histidine kinase